MLKKLSIEKKKAIIDEYVSGSDIYELMRRYEVSYTSMRILLGRYEKGGIEGLEKYLGTHADVELKKRIVREYAENCISLWQLSVKYDVGYSSICRWMSVYRREGERGLCGKVRCRGQSRGEDEKREILREYGSGVSVSELTRRYGISHQALRILVYRYGKYGADGLHTGGRSHLSYESKKRIIREYCRRGTPLWRLSVEEDVSYSSVCLWLHKYKSGGYAALRRKRPRKRRYKNMEGQEKTEAQGELEKLRDENLRLRARLATIKKVRALMREAQRKSGKR